jgi:alpha-L-fucosidase
MLEMKSTTARKEQGFNTVFTSEDFWFTQKDNNVYAICLTGTYDNSVSIEALYQHRDKIRSIRMLGVKGKLKWRASDGKINVSIPAGKNPDVPGFVLKVSM